MHLCYCIAERDGVCFFCLLCCLEAAAATAAAAAVAGQMYKKNVNENKLHGTAGRHADGHVTK